MAAPTQTSRTTPTGFKMPEGFKATYAFATQPAVKFWEDVVTPIGYDGGEAINTTTQHNVEVDTKDFSKLYEITDGEIEAAYDPDVISVIRSMINRKDSVTLWMPDGSNWCFYGGLTMFKGDPFERRKFPKAKIKIVVTNWDPVNNIEVLPVFIAAAGT